MSDAEQKKPKTLSETIAELPGRILRPQALNTVLLLVIGATGIVYAQTKGKDVLDAGVAPVKAELQQHIVDEAKRIVEVQADVAAVKRQLEASEERSARRFEVLYNTILERRPQPGADELTKPQTDGGR